MGGQLGLPKPEIRLIVDGLREPLCLSPAIRFRWPVARQLDFHALAAPLSDVLRQSDL